ncbi:isochorismate synthase [Listeria booriae]|uniref:isochorismate synthase n=1 Tax=Listeria booriae TaxID=1552123 RepID=UPI00164D79E7|nr:isochorismate synthase [Listeria booriae]MBC6163863.1 isochorismate synthase [Listeria booriae]
MGLTLPVELFEQAKRTMNSQKEQVLLSWVSELTDMTAKQLFDQAETFKGERFFWQNKERSLRLAGFGVMDQLRIEPGGDRFSALHTRKEQVLRRTVTNSEESACGAVYFGGFRFDAQSDVAPEWESFGQGLFYLPLFLVTEKEGHRYLSVNIWLSADDAYDKVEAVMAQWERICDATPSSDATPDCILEERLAEDAWLAAATDVVALLQDTEHLQKVVLARRMRLGFDGFLSSSRMIANMEAQQGNSYCFVLENGTRTFFGATPERLVLADETRMESACVAGSIGRGTTDAEDEALGATLLNDAKNLAEHHFVVEMIEETMARFCEDVEVSANPELLKNRDIQHLYMTVAGNRGSAKLLDVVRALHPTPALGGWPQEDAMTVIRLKEAMDRGLYGAPIGWIDAKDRGEFVVAIRSALAVDTDALLYAGCGIVADSVPVDELAETAMKFQPMLRVLGGKVHERS